MHTQPNQHQTTPRTHTVRVGTFADGQRATSVTVTYAPVVGSFADVDRRA
ncbi:MAG: hypothetical protein WBQ18_11905 [Solirubrobacteraceae bacterium]